MLMGETTAPTTVAGSAVREFLAACGVTRAEDVRFFAVEPAAVYVETLKRNADGHHYVIGHGPDAKVAVAELRIPIRWSL